MHIDKWEKSGDRLEMQDNQTAGRTSEEWSFPFGLFLLPRRQTASVCVRQLLCIRIPYLSTRDTFLLPSLRQDYLIKPDVLSHN